MKKEYIDREAFLKSVLTAGIGKTIKEFSESDIGYMIRKQPAADVVSRKYLNQIKFERDLAIEQLNSYGISLGEKAECAKVVHGEWNFEYDAERDPKLIFLRIVCSNCGLKTGQKSNYCPNCGAKMDGGKENETD